MFQLIFTLATGLLAIWRFVRGVGGGSASSKAMVAFLVGSSILSIIDFIGLGLITFFISDAFLDYGISTIQASLNSIGGQQYSAILFDFLYTIMFPQALSVVFSALSIAFTIKGTRWAMKFNGFFTPAA